MEKLNNKERTLHDQFSRYGKNAKEWMKKCVLLLPKIEKHRVWEKKGFSSIYDYGAKLAGMSRNSIEDALRILRKIEDKPAFKKLVEQRGINSVRPVLSIAKEGNIEFWAKKASEMSKNTLEAYVREFRTSTELVGCRPDMETGGKTMSRRTSTENGVVQEKDTMTNNDFHTDQRQKDQDKQQEELITNIPKKALLTLDLDPEIAEELQKLKGTGVLVGILLSVLMAFIFNSFLGGFEGRNEEIVEGVLMWTAGVLITWMIIWMLKQRAKIRAHIEKKVGKHVENNHPFGIFMIATVSVLREGIETVIFLFALNSKSSVNLLVAILGALLAIGLGIGIFVFSRKISLRPFFTATSLLLIFIAGGLFADGLHEFQEAQILPNIIPVAAVYITYFAFAVGLFVHYDKSPLQAR